MSMVPLSGLALLALWNVCVEVKEQCINSTTQGVDTNRLLTYTFLGLFGVVMGVFWWVARNKHGPFQYRW